MEKPKKLMVRTLESDLGRLTSNRPGRKWRRRERGGGSVCPVQASSTGSRGVISYIYIIYFYLLCGDNQFTNIDTLWMKKIRTRGDGVREGSGRAGRQNPRGPRWLRG